MKGTNVLKGILPEAQLALLIANCVIGNNRLSEIKDLLTRKHLKWERFNRFLAYHEISSFAYLYLKKYPDLLPGSELELLRKSCFFYSAHLSYLWREFMEIADVFNNNNIPFLPLKGIAFIIDNIHGIDKAFLRPMCDIDILIKKETLPLAEKTIETLGYEKDLHGTKEEYWKGQNYHLSFMKYSKRRLSCAAEIHWALDYKRDNPILPHLWSRVKKYKIEDRTVYLLSPEDTLFCLALHNRRFGKTLCLKDVCSVSAFLSKYSGILDWDYIIREAKRGKMRTTLYFILTQADLLADAKMPGSAVKELNIPVYKRWLIKQFIQRNTFAYSLGENTDGVNIKELYLKNHFLLYDNFWEPVRCILNIPQEQFAKFYGWKPYTRKTLLIYKIRYLFMVNSLVFIGIKTLAKRLSRFQKK